MFSFKSHFCLLKLSSSHCVVRGQGFEGSVDVVTGQNPDEGVTSAADLCQKSSFGLSRSIGSLFFGLLHKCFVRKDGLELKITKSSFRIVFISKYLSLFKRQFKLIK